LHETEKKTQRKTVQQEKETSIPLLGTARANTSLISTTTASLLSFFQGILRRRDPRNPLEKANPSRNKKRKESENGRAKKTLTFGDLNGDVQLLQRVFLQLDILQQNVSLPNSNI